MAKLRKGSHGELEDPTLFNVNLGTDYVSPQHPSSLEATWTPLPWRISALTSRAQLIATASFRAATNRLFLIEAPHLFVEAQGADGMIRSARLCDTKDLDPGSPLPDRELILDLDLAATGVRLAFGEEVGVSPVVGGIQAVAWRTTDGLQDLAHYDLVFRPKHSEVLGQ